VKPGSLLWPADLPGRVLTAAFLCLPLCFAILSVLAWHQQLSFEAVSIVIGAWLVAVGVLLAVPNPSRGTLPRLANLGIVLAGAGWIAIGFSSTLLDATTFALLDVGGLLLALIGLVLAGSAGLGALSARRSK